MAKIKMNNVAIENARICYRNFAGAQTRFNQKGDRNFAVILDDPDFAEHLASLGWNVKVRPPREEGDEPFRYLSVAVRYDNIPPMIYVITSSGKRLLTAETVDMLDYADITNIDLTLHPAVWELNGRTGVKAYLKSAYITIEEDEFAAKYSAIDDMPF